MAGLRDLATNPDTTVAELNVNRRQHHRWERDALAELRDGHVGRAVATDRAHDRVVVTDDRAATITTGVDRWLAAHRDGAVPVLLAGTNQTADALNTAVRQTLIDHGVLGPPVAGTGGSLAVGERLMIPANDYQAAIPHGQQTAVLNGQTGTLTAAADSSATGRRKSSRAVALSRARSQAAPNSPGGCSARPWRPSTTSGANPYPRRSVTCRPPDIRQVRARLAAGTAPRRHVRSPPAEQAPPQARAAASSFRSAPHGTPP